jgi:prepilin-type N-terminal cleavage/methylation domain-containing protein
MTSAMGPASRRGVRGFTLIELLVVIAIIGILIALLLPALAKAKCVTRNGACFAQINDLGRAMESYETDFGIYPSKPGTSALADDTTIFINCLLQKGPKFTSYYSVKDDDMSATKELLSQHEKPIHYKFPGGSTAGPDGKTHSSMPYLLWTWGCLGPEPDCNYEINNWTR